MSISERCEWHFCSECGDGRCRHACHDSQRYDWAAGHWFDEDDDDDA